MMPYYWWYYSPYYYPLAFPPMTFIYDLYNLMLATYYWKLYIETFRMAMETWSKSFEAMFKALEAQSKTSTT
ncbi:MAG: hypothetical protein DRJ26_02845 [Candidatus Methanomethylicota archaeon]|uniref:Uncharacterized protein n=1 Tax=Thermoproteota archaeon TaxID=2056631 RepID=A0A497F2G5_9CREN|nr:MAG: hypothetical protein DRJ26_02845 [Candidatus Verstraetearchaeota archaeon]